MKISFDYEIFWKQRFGGISRYFFNLIYNLHKNKNSQIKIFSQLYFNEYLEKLPREIIKGKKINKLFPYTGKFFETITRNLSNRNLLKFDPDIIHKTYYNNNFQKKKKIVLTIFDLIHEILANSKEFKPKQKAINQAEKIICISNNTKQDLINIYNVNPEKISVIYLGYEHLNFSSKIIDNTKIKIDKPYILYVGSRKKYKNFNFFLNSFSRSKKLMNDFNIILFGGENVTEHEKKIMYQLHFKEDQIKHFNGTDDFLTKLYKNASALIFPSSYEGFGIPIIEAMSLECPVVCSTAKVFKEIAFNSAEFFDVNSHQSLVNSIEKVVYNQNISDSLKEKGLKNLKNFGWKNCTLKTMQVYETLI